MPSENSDRTRLNRRQFIGATAGAGLVSAGFTGTAVGTVGNGGGGDGGGGDGNGEGGGGGDGGGGEFTVTLITGETIHVVEDGNERVYEVEDDGPTAFEVTEEVTGTYIVPHDANLDRLSREFFNIDLLIEQGFTNDQIDAIPVIVTIDSDGSRAQNVGLQSVGGFTPTKILRSINGVAGTVDPNRAGAASQSILNTNNVERIYLDVRYETELDVSAPAINAPQARDEFGVEGEGIRIAILDTGIDADHPDFGDRVVYQKDFSGDGIQDAFGHGTHCAGIAAGAGTVSEGEYVGIAPGADLMNIKVLGDNGSGPLSDIVEGIEHAVEEDAHVISMSLGGPVQEDDPMETAVNQAAKDGVVVSVSAGNSYGYQSITSPGQAERAITVAASAPENNEIAAFSSGGPTPLDYRIKPNVAAPGVGITAAGSQNAGEYPYTDKNGTSMAAPHVTGLSALLVEHYGWGPDEVRDRLVSTADPFEGVDIYRQGSGQVNALAALESDFRIHDSVTNFGLYNEPTTDTATIKVENTGDESTGLDLTAELWNVQSEEYLSDNVSVDPKSVTVAPGETKTVEVEIDTTDAYGFNSGVLVMNTGDGTSHRAIFGFVMGVEVVVEKLAHERSAGVENDQFQAWAHDGSFSESSFAAFNADGEYSFLLFSDGGTFTFWSSGELEAKEGQLSGEPTMTVKSNVHIDRENTHFTMDENATVPRALNTDPVSHHEPFEMRGFEVALYGVTDDVARRYSHGFTGDFGIDTGHFSPVDEDDPTNVSNEYLTFPEELGGEYDLESPYVYWVFFPSLSVPADGESLELDTDDLAAEHFEYHRNYKDQLYGLAPHMFPVDQENYPQLFSFAILSNISDDLVEQTWYRTPAEARYTETWYDDGSFISGNWRFSRMIDLVPEKDVEYQHAFNREPLVGYASEWNLGDGSLNLLGHWYADQADKHRPFLSYAYDSANPNEYSITVDGEVVAENTSIGHSFSAGAENIDAGSELEVSMNGNTLVDTQRETTTVTDYDVTYGSGTNTPPQVNYVDVTGLTTLNEVPAGPVVAFVDIAHAAASVDRFRVFYAPTGSVSGTPFERPGGWQEADVIYSDGSTYGILLDTAGYSGAIEFAAAATDTAGNRVRTTTFDAIQLTAGDDHTATLDVQPNSVNPESNQMIPTVIESTDGVDTSDIDLDSLRFGSVDAVDAGEGASPFKAWQIGQGPPGQRDGPIKALFRVTDTGFACTSGPITGKIAGGLADGTTFAGVDIIPHVSCGD